MTKVRTFRDLVAWQRAMELARAVYAFAARLPSSEEYGLAAQVKRAAVSVASNIAEGHGRHSRPDMIRFLRIARGSLFELATQVELARSIGLAPVEQQLLDLIEETDRIISALARSLARIESGAEAD